MRHLSMLLVALATLMLASFQAVFAQQSSPNYKTEEYFFGTGGELDSSSANYKAQSSVGSLGVGTGSSANYQAFSGFLTPNEPFLEMVVSTSLVDLGDLEANTTKTGTSVFQVRGYTNSGYTVATVSPTPQKGPASLDPMTTQGASTVGTEQFGINLVGPNDVGAGNFGSNPVPQPDSSFASGQAATGYNTTNQYKYNQGDIIANTGTSGWGQTIFTISYIANVSYFTEAGKYSVVHDLVVVATF